MNDNRFQQKYRVDSARLAGYDYGSNGAYFITVCTRNRENYFGEIDENAALITTAAAQIVVDCWQAIPTHFPFVVLNAFVLMPNHLHGILFFDKPDYNDGQPNQFGPQIDNLAAVVRGFKAGVTKQTRTQQIDFGWQPRYHDRVVRNDDELNRIRTYIDNNPSQWQQDRDNPENLYM